MKYLLVPDHATWKHEFEKLLIYKTVTRNRRGDSVANLRKLASVSSKYFGGSEQRRRLTFSAKKSTSVSQRSTNVAVYFT